MTVWPLVFRPHITFTVDWASDNQRSIHQCSVKSNLCHKLKITDIKIDDVHVRVQDIDKNAPGVTDSSSNTLGMSFLSSTVVSL